MGRGAASTRCSISRRLSPVAGRPVPRDGLITTQGRAGLACGDMSRPAPLAAVVLAAGKGTR